MYNEHKFKHVLKFQALTTADGLIVNIYGSIGDRRHYWTIYTLNNLEEQIPGCLTVEDTKYWVYDDSGYA